MYVNSFSSSSILLYSQCSMDGLDGYSPSSPPVSAEASRSREQSPVERLEPEERSLERPSLQLQDVEGRIHKYEGMLSRMRKTKLRRTKLKSGWKRRWFRVIPGK